MSMCKLMLAIAVISSLTACPQKDPAPEPKEGNKPPEAMQPPPEAVPKPPKAIQPPPNAKEPGASSAPKTLTVGADEGIYDSIMQEAGAHAIERVAVQASSVLCEPRTGFCHAASRLVDRKSATAWCEGAPGSGEGAKLTLDFGRPREVVSLRFEPSYAKNKQVMFDNARIKKLAIAGDDGQLMHVVFSDQDPEFAFKPGMQIDFSVPTVGFAKPLETRRLTLEVLEVYPGRRFKDLCVSEVTVYAK